jgi:hypothetical protein
MTARQQLESLSHGKTKRIKGQLVKRLDDEYSINDESAVSIEIALELLNESNTPTSGINFSTTVFIERLPHSPHSVAGIVHVHRVASKAEYTKLIAAVVSRRHYLWYGTITTDEQGQEVARPPFLLEFDTVPDVPYGKESTAQLAKQWKGGLSCPFCGQSVSSTPGRTLHVKGKHPERFEEYVKLQEPEPPKPEPPKPVSSSDEDDIVERLEESNDRDWYVCPQCQKKCSSQSGLTLHVKTHEQ